ncbi:cysteine hydrolase family protein [Numidum massiliense]|uniref:cysteine hydrolase family protein n=1 Tax=Numidum massiliense TaxID=1522315 RepID=UPI0006D5968C|nr:isochorismatase family cysteine hydrolase [Numidum massiliense]
MSKALIVVDMIHDFVADDGTLTCGLPGQKIVGNIVREIYRAVEEGGHVFLLGDHHEPDDPEFAMWPKHAVKGTPGAAWVAPIDEAYRELVATGRIEKINKTKYDAFFRTPLAEKLEAAGTDRVEVAGVCTSICVNATVLAASYRGYPVTVRRSCVADFDQQKHDMFLEHMAAICKADIVD